jgi:hypothetical protein
MDFMIKHISTGTYTEFSSRPYRFYLIAQKRRPFSSGPRGSGRRSNLTASTTLSAWAS